MKRWLLPGLALAFAACTPSVPTGTDNSTKYVVAEFDPANSVIPLPNDLAAIDPATGVPDLKPDGGVRQLHAPTTGGSDAQNEFNRDYLNTLDGFPMESAATVQFDKAIDGGSVHVGQNLLVFDHSANDAPVTALTTKVTSVPDGGSILSFGPTGGYWTRGHQYAVLIVGGANGIQGASPDQTLIGSSTWALVTSSTPLVKCDQTTGENCHPATSAIPTTEKDPAAQLAQQLATARQLEALRLSYAPLIARAGGAGIPASDVALAWTFTITSQPEVAFAPPGVLPFPNDALNPTGSQVTIPPGTGLPDALVAGLNTLDGFSTTAPIVSENGPATGALIGGSLPGTPYTLADTGPINLTPTGTRHGADAGPALDAFACVNCTVSPTLLDGGVKPETLEIVPRVPLNERTQYAAYITTDLTDRGGTNVIASPAFALTRSSAPLFQNGKSTVSILSDTDAEQLEQLRLGLKPLFDGLAAKGLQRKKLALGWAFTTQSTVSTLAQIHGAPYVAPNLPSAPLWNADITAAVTPVLDGKGIPHNAVSAFWAGEVVDLWALTSGHFAPGLADATGKPMPYVLTIPAGSAPATGWPVVIFGHGLTGDKTNAFAIANTLASIGQAMIAIDEPWHGDRNTCTGFGAFSGTADVGACINPGGSECNAVGRCQQKSRGTGSGLAPCVFGTATADLACLGAGQGACAPDNQCEGPIATTGFNPATSGWNLFNLVDLFATRDNFRQQVISHSQLARVIVATGPGGFTLSTPPGTSVKLDPTKISYVSQSLGSFLGSLYAAVAPEVGNTALNVAGSDWALNLLTSPAFSAQRNGFIAGLAAQGVEQNSPEYDQFLGIAKWILDPADPVNAAYYVTHSADLPAPLPPNIDPTKRRTFIQWILDDQVVVNPSTVELINAASGAVVADPTRLATSKYWAYQFNGAILTSIPTCDRHPFLLLPSDGVCGAAGPPTAAGLNLTGTGQGQIATFLSGAAPF